MHLGLQLYNTILSSGADADVAAYITRVEADGGTIDEQALDELLVYVAWLKANDLWSDIYNFLPAGGYKAGKLYALVPDDGSGDYDVTRNSERTRVDPDSLIETLAVNVPAIDYGTGEAVILMEEERSNLQIFSETSPTSGGGIGSIIESTSESVINNTYAWKITEDTLTNRHRVYKSIDSAQFTIGQNYCFSIIVKKIDDDWGQLLITSASHFATDSYVNFNLSTGELGNIGTDCIAQGVEQYSDGSCRVWLVTQCIGNTGTMFGWLVLGTNNTDSSKYYSYLGTGRTMWDITGWQCEHASAPSSYIPTAGATVTRLKDVIDGATYAGASESGVLFANIRALANDLTARIMSINDGTTTNRVYLFYSTTTNQIKAVVEVGGVTVCSLTYTVTDITEVHKAAVRWKVNDFSLWVDGVERDTDAAGVSFGAAVLTSMDFDRGDGTLNFFGEDKVLSAYAYLDDTKMGTLTT